MWASCLNSGKVHELCSSGSFFICSVTSGLVIWKIIILNKNLTGIINCIVLGQWLSFRHLILGYACQSRLFHRKTSCGSEHRGFTDGFHKCKASGGKMGPNTPHLFWQSFCCPFKGNHVQDRVLTYVCTFRRFCVSSSSICVCVHVHLCMGTHVWVCSHVWVCMHVDAWGWPWESPPLIAFPVLRWLGCLSWIQSLPMTGLPVGILCGHPPGTGLSGWLPSPSRRCGDLNFRSQAYTVLFPLSHPLSLPLQSPLFYFVCGLFTCMYVCVPCYAVHTETRQASDLFGLEL